MLKNLFFVQNGILMKSNDFLTNLCQWITKIYTTKSIWQIKDEFIFVHKITHYYNKEHVIIELISIKKYREDILKKGT